MMMKGRDNKTTAAIIMMTAWWFTFRSLSCPLQHTRKPQHRVARAASSRRCDAHLLVAPAVAFRAG